MQNYKKKLSNVEWCDVKRHYIKPSAEVPEYELFRAYSFKFSNDSND